jgi:hypothetical protein
MTRKTCVSIGLVLAAGAMTPALAAQHLVGIQEVFVGTPSDATNSNLTPDQRAQYVMLRMASQGETQVSGAAIRVEDAAGNILGKFGAFTAALGNGGSIGCTYPSCPASVIGTTAAKNLFTFAFNQIVDGQAGRVALPVAGGRACWTNGSTTVYDCVAWGNFSCTAVNCPAGPNAFHSGDLNGNACASSFGTPAPALQFGKALARSAYICGTKTNSTQFSLQFPKPVNNAGANNNTDTDADGLIDQLDCNPANAAIQWPPVEVANVRVSGSPISTDSWDSQAAFVGTGVTYDEIRGSLSQLANFTDEGCLDPATSLTSSPDAAVPPANDGFYYLVRASGGAACVGTYGKLSTGTPRDPQLTACP